MEKPKTIDEYLSRFPDATPSGHAPFAEELSSYKQGKGSVQFPIDEPVPYELIAKIVQFRVCDQAQQPRKKKN